MRVFGDATKAMGITSKKAVFLLQSVLQATLLLSAGCGRTGLLDCATAGLNCPPIGQGRMAKCRCDCTAAGFSIGGGVAPVCLPPSLVVNSGADVEQFCRTLPSQAVEAIARNLIDLCGLGSCECHLEESANGVALTPNDNCNADCGTTECKFCQEQQCDKCPADANCNKCVFTSDGKLHLDQCQC